MQLEGICVRGCMDSLPQGNPRWPVGCGVHGWGIFDRRHECVRTLSLTCRSMGKLAKKMLRLGTMYIYSRPCTPTLTWPSFCPQFPIDPAHYSNNGNTPTDKTFSQASNLVGMSKWVHPSGIDTGKEESSCACFPLLSALVRLRSGAYAPDLMGCLPRHRCWQG